MRIQLISVDDGKVIELERELTVVGRKAECDIFIDHKTISKAHCVLVRADGLLFIRDLGSTNGTRVNGVRIRRATLLPSDKLQIASFDFRLQWLNEPVVDSKPQPAESDRQKSLNNKGADSDDDIVLSEDAPLVRNNALPDIIDKSS